ncbi:MTH1187 family thiamine-binding protein [Salisediminibacterium selenitireducens]|uniref:Thiamine-binding protein domain-containing protein n=1 Tax=Bacillus selenitireducens (strain ATCC 700615 / DSM 15326 / MLS10) TaxID=439292 RepID=D6XW52_BACIE|nr:MTH1187 family thiamine-binding protein [Salisediminibacterium selenitireducens]ADH99806.1 protein of unknown function DUF77 [[Bacillus] selenitireducens MLS10]
MKGMSYQHGVIFVGERYMGGAEIVNNRSISWVEPVTAKAMFRVSVRVFKSMPLWFKWAAFISFLISLLPWMTGLYSWEQYYGVPFYLWVYFFLGTHFWFPSDMKRFHGAEHKVFSTKELVSVRHIKTIAKASIINRYCSTNVIVLFFLTVPILLIPFLLISDAPFIHVFEWTTMTSLIILPVLVRWLNRGTHFDRVRQAVLTLSYFVQRAITTAEPDEVHIRTAVKAYRRVVLKENPSRLTRGKPIKKRTKGGHQMAIADITIMPLGSQTTSVSEVVAEVHKRLKETDLPLEYTLTPMSTIIEGKPEDLYTIIREIHEVPFTLGHQRIALNVRIDDRRDKATGMAMKLSSVNQKLSE